LDDNFTIDHLAQFADVWTCLQGIHLIDDVEDDIVWNLIANDLYSAKSAYEVQYFGSIYSPMYKTVWKA
jgi:hypothetical protein